MAKVEVNAGVCGHTAVIQTTLEGKVCKIDIQSSCPAIQKMAGELAEVDPYQEISYRRKTPLTLEMAAKYCSHAACPVPVGIIKAVEVEARLALPVDVSMKITR